MHRVVEPWMSQVAEKTRNSRRKFRKFVLSTFALVGLMAVCWSAYDLYLPQQLRMRDFDPAKVARLETGMWRSYYERRPINTFNQFAEALRTQFHLPVLRSIAIAYRASAAAFTFKAGHSRPDYEKALPDLIRFYVSVREAGDIHFDPVRAAKFELEWWIIHRERDRHPPSDLVNALAELQAEIYQVPVDTVRMHAE